MDSETTSCGAGREELLTEDGSDDSSVEADVEDLTEEVPASSASDEEAAATRWSDISDSDVPPPSVPKLCKFGSECYSKRCRFVHPARESTVDGVPRNLVSLRPCKHGCECRNFKEEHRRRFRHPEIALETATNASASPSFLPVVDARESAMHGLHYYIMIPAIVPLV